ncbi:hypothetical protein VTK73DRAFT_1469 [Phialemonium thermophilum]|uniref:Glycosyltransferase sugar-binding region containing DXD motif-containing protein n=1 Tax=Phialemonium thermophilum TaxID=223376 RepID=A0ABR3X9X4_9PEZI
MRLRLKTAVLGALVLFPTAFLLVNVTARVRRFIQIFHEHSGVTLTQLDVALAYNTSRGSAHGKPVRQQVIPKIVHQVFDNWNAPGNETLPADWADVRKTCIERNPEWQHMLWTERASRDFIAAKYPWFLKTYDGYLFPVQRVDAVRYFLMLHCGGIYIDLDNKRAA